MELKNEIYKYYDKNGDIGNFIMSNYKNVSVSKKQQEHVMTILGDSKRIVECTYTYIGSYDKLLQLWMWSYNNFTLNDKQKKYKDKLDKFKEKLERDVGKYKDIIFLHDVYNNISNDVFMIKPDNLLDLVKTCIYVLGGKGVMFVASTVDGVNKIDAYLMNEIIYFNVVTIDKSKKDKKNCSNKDKKSGKCKSKSKRNTRESKIRVVKSKSKKKKKITINK